MRRIPKQMSRTLTVAFALLAGGAASAQATPTDDPAFSAPTSPAPTPAPAPAPAPTAAPAPTSSLRVISAPAAAPVAARAPAASETVSVETHDLADADNADLYERVAAPTLFGGVGLFHMLTGDSGRSQSFRVGLHIGGFQQSSFLIGGNSSVAGDTNQHFNGDLTVSYTPWKYIEAYFGIFNASNRNERTDAQRTDQPVILSLGDLELGVKGRYNPTKYIDVALHLDVRFLNAVSGISFSGKSTNFGIDGIASFDMRHLDATRMVPLRFHVNFGYLLDNSSSLFPAGQCGLSTSDDACIRSRVVETFAYGVGYDRLRLAIGADTPWEVHSVGLSLITEYHIEFPLGDGDQTVLHALENDPRISHQRLTGQRIQYLTLGARIRPVAGLILDAGVDLGLESPGFQYGPPVPEWNVIVGAAYAFEPGARKTRVITKTITRTLGAPAPVTGTVGGIVRDATNKHPIGGVLVKYVGSRSVTPQVTSDDGTFESYDLPPGPLTLDVSADNYQPTRVDVSIAAANRAPVEIMLTPLPPKNGALHVQLVDAQNKPVTVGGVVRLTSASGAIIDADAAEPGGFITKLPPGNYVLDASADGYLGRQMQVEFRAGGDQSVVETLTKRPAVSHVTLKKDEIAIKGSIHFGTGNADIKPDGEQLLNEVADVLIKNPQIKKIRVEGHTDNRGGVQKNLDLSRARARAVVEYLVKQGLDSARLESEGYGASQPLVPNITPANRTKNRRVAFKILEATP